MRMYKLKKQMPGGNKSGHSSGGSTPFNGADDSSGGGGTTNDIVNKVKQENYVSNAQVPSPGQAPVKAKTPGGPQSFKAPTPAHTASTPGAASVLSPAPATPYNQIPTPSITPHTPQAMTDEEHEKFWEQVRFLDSCIL